MRVSRLGLVDGLELKKLPNGTYLSMLFQYKDEIIKKTAEGNTTSEIAKALREEHELSVLPLQVAEFQKRHRDEIAAYIRKHGNSILAQAFISHKPIRVQRIERLCELLSQGINDCAKESKWSQAAKLADILLKAYRLVGEETHDLTKTMQGVNVYVQLIQAAPPERKAQIAEKIDEIRQLLGASANVLDAGTPGKGTGDGTGQD